MSKKLTVTIYEKKTVTGSKHFSEDCSQFDRENK